MAPRGEMWKQRNVTATGGSKAFRRLGSKGRREDEGYEPGLTTS